MIYGILGCFRTNFIKLHFIVLKRNIFKKEENDLFNFSKNMNVDPCIDDLWKVSADWSGPLKKNFSASEMVWNDDILIVFFLYNWFNLLFI